MPDLLSISTSALTAVDQWLSTTSHNIANVNTPGYSRQTVDLSTNASTLMGDQYVGNGVNVNGVQREYNSFLTNNVWSTTGQQGQAQTFSDMTTQVDNLLGNTTSGLSPAMNNFFTATQGVANDPTATAARQEMLSTGETLVKTFNTQASQLDNMAQQVNSQMTTQVAQINNLATTIAKYNNDISTATARTSGNGTPNDLQDARDEAIRQLAEIVGVNVFQQSDGTANVFIGNGQNLVTGSQVRQLAVVGNPYDPSQNEIALGPSANATSNQTVSNTAAANSTPDIVSGQITGGSLGGLLQFRNTVLQPAQNGLGRVAVGLTTTINQQQQQGMDLNGHLGGALFQISAPRTFPNANNNSDLQVSAQITDPTQLSTSDYRLDVTVNGYTLTKLSDGTTTNLTTAPGNTSGGTIQLEPPVDGISVQISSTSNSVGKVGDSFLIKPTQSSADGVSLAITDPTQVAAASPISTAAVHGNTGSGSLSVTQVVDTTNPAFASTGKLTPPLLIRFDSPPPAGGGLTYSVYNNTDPANPVPVMDNSDPKNPVPLQHIPYNPAQDRAVFPQGGVDYGYRVTLSGTPKPGDSFTIGYNTNGTGDNRNMLALNKLQNTDILAGKTATFQDAYGQMVAEVGTETQHAQVTNTAAQTLLTQAKSAQQSVAGVNLDEEAAHLLNYQQAYQASAQLVSTASTLFNTILSAIGK